ncbi:MAG: sulfite exporter TauE/SafE family protein [Candidatus Thorarchaeota archaeon]
MDINILLLTAIIGLFSGFASGFFGIGGGSIRIPLLTLVGFTLVAAYGMNLIALPISSLMGAVSQRKNIDLHLGSYMVLGGAVGTIVGTLIVFDFGASAILLAIIFLLVSIMSVIAMNLHNIAPSMSDDLSPSFNNMVSGTLVFNTLTGMRGGSEGSLFVPLQRLFNVEMHKAIATALFAAIFTSIVGVLLYWGHGQLLLLPGVIVLIGSTIGSRIGSHFSLGTKSKWLEVGLTLVILILAGVPLLEVQI